MEEDKANREEDEEVMGVVEDLSYDIIVDKLEKFLKISRILVLPVHTAGNWIMLQRIIHNV